MSNPQTFTAKDIERYHGGQMTPAEMHELEKAALDDPLLADALEGFRYTTTASADLQRLQSRLQQRLENEDRKVVPLFRNQWLRIAALFLLMAGGGWLVFQTLSPKENNLATTETTASDIALTLDSAAPLQQSLPPALATDSISSLQDMAAAETPPQPLEKKGSAPQTMLDKTASANKPAREDNTATVNEALAAAPVADQVPLNTVPTVSAGRMKDSSATREAMATRRSRTDTEEKTTLSQARSNMLATEPVEGWKAFTDYVQKNRRSYEALKLGAPVRGEVGLQFIVDANGEPTAISISKSLCTQCDEEAIRLLKEGPKWKNPNSIGNVVIPFR